MRNLFRTARKLALVLLFPLGVMAAEPVVNEVRIVNLKRFAGMALNVFYVSGMPAFLGVAGQSLSIRQVQTDPVRLAIDANGEVVIPARIVPRSGFSVFNNMVLVVTKVGAPPVFMKNADGSRPPDPRMPQTAIASLPAQHFQFDRMAVVGATRFPLISNTGTSQPLVLDAARDLNW